MFRRVSAPGIRGPPDAGFDGNTAKCFGKGCPAIATGQHQKSSMKAGLNLEPERNGGLPGGKCFPAGWLSRAVMMMSALCALTWAAPQGRGGDAAAPTEHQVKALFLLNFTKYVEWPEEAFLQTNSPIIIGVLGDEEFGGLVKTAVEGKTANGRPIEEHTFARGGDWGKCHILFISAAEKKRTKDILERVKATPTLTVGEMAKFAEQGGVINFTMKDAKVRLEIDLNAARQAKLQVSSKLLSVADAVHGKP